MASALWNLRGRSAFIATSSSVYVIDNLRVIVSAICLADDCYVCVSRIPGEVVLTFGYSVTSLLVSRFILDLRNEYMARNGDQDTLMSMADLSDIRFAPESSVISIRNPDGSATEGC